MCTHVRRGRRIHPFSSLPQTLRDPAGAGRRRPRRARSEQRWSPTQRLRRGLSDRSDASAGVSTVGLGAWAWGMRACRGDIAGTMGRHRAACPGSLSVDRVSKGLRRLERRRSRGRDGDGLPGRWIAALVPGAAADDELPDPNPAMVTGWSRARASPMAENTAAIMRSAPDPGHGRLGGDVGDEVVPVHLLSSPGTAIGWRGTGGAPIKRALSVNATQPV